MKRISYAARYAAAWLSLLIALGHAPRAYAQSAEDKAQDQDPGTASDALPGVRKLALVTPFDEGWSAAGTLAYGYTESVERLRDAHHRALIEAGGSYALAEWIAFGARMAGRYDTHDRGASDGDSSFVLSTRLAARARSELGSGISVGGELAFVFPGADSVARGFESITPELRALGSYTGLHPKLVLGAQLGVRLDRSGEAIADPYRLSAADRVALGASDSSAILLGVGGTYSVSPELLVIGELGWDALVDHVEATVSAAKV